MLPSDDVKYLKRAGAGVGDLLGQGNVLLSIEAYDATSPEDTSLFQVAMSAAEAEQLGRNLIAMAGAEFGPVSRDESEEA